MKRVARPPDESEKIDKDDLKKLMKYCLSAKEVADFFDLNNIKTLTRYIKTHFKCSFVQLRDKGFIRTKLAIKRAQIEKALTGDNTMMIWCGKQYLGQSDNPEAQPDSGGYEISYRKKCRK